MSTRNLINSKFFSLYSFQCLFSSWYKDPDKFHIFHFVSRNINLFNLEESHYLKKNAFIWYWIFEEIKPVSVDYSPFWICLVICKTLIRLRLNIPGKFLHRWDNMFHIFHHFRSQDKHKVIAPTIMYVRIAYLIKVVTAKSLVSIVLPMAGILLRILLTN